MADQAFTIAAYRKNVAERKIMASRCNLCDALHLPPRPICTNCHGRDLAWEELGGAGTILGFTSITISPTAMAAKGYGRDKPYLTAIVALDEGPSTTARIEVDSTEDLEKSIHVGMAVRADFVEETEGEDMKVTLVFRPA
ncbi:MAG: OB-fold domain-containing protein [SAR202 cluster bacterium]|jgi:hypothetical protein|nr:OB-fold domain-containing protein [SAR202 cluster bacterium]|tara:strand:- start:272 stop:691 length:420 start_codon:yes stop_codon:yes gene_type:complete